MNEVLIFWSGWGLRPTAFAPLDGALPAHWTRQAPDLLASAQPSLRTWGKALAASVPEGAILVGWSLGAQLALAATLAGASPKALVLIGASPCFTQTTGWKAALDKQTVWEFCENFRHFPAAALHHFLALQAVGDAHRGQVLSSLRPALAEPSAAGLGDALTALVEGDLREGLEAITCPVLLVHGEKDALMPRAAAQWLATQLPDANLETLHECGHAPHVSAPQAVAEAILRQLEGLK